MNFRQALELMKAGHKITRPSWIGYWYWDEDKKTVIIHTKDGNEFDLFDSDDKELTLNSLSCCDFTIACEDGTEFVFIYKLEDTINLMVSDDYKERFKAEYYQTKIRYEKLKKFNNKIEAWGKLSFAEKYGKQEPKHDCPKCLLQDQQRVMREYLHILEIRAEIEGIDL